MRPDGTGTWWHLGTRGGSSRPGGYLLMKVSVRLLPATVGSGEHGGERKQNEQTRNKGAPVSLTEVQRVVDADSHMTERHDLFTERAPKGYEDKVPHVERIDDVDMWVIEGKTFGKAGSGGTVDHAGHKHPFRDSQGGTWGINDVHPAAWDPKERLRLMDHLGIDSQVLYPNSIGIGGQNLANSVHDPTLLRLCVELYNDAMAEVQEESGNRLLPMPIMPAWDIDECVREATRCAALGYRGVNMTADPQDSGSPDLGDTAWDPFWEVCAGLDLPVHFHIGASQTSLSYFGTTYWPSQDDYVKPAIGGASLFQESRRWACAPR